MYKYFFTLKFFIWLIPLVIGITLLISTRGQSGAPAIVLAATALGFLSLAVIGTTTLAIYRSTVAYENDNFLARVILKNKAKRGDAFCFIQNVSNPTALIFNLLEKEAGPFHPPTKILFKIVEVGSIDWAFSPRGKAYGLCEDDVCRIEYRSVEKMKSLTVEEISHSILFYNEYEGDHHELINKIMDKGKELLFLKDREPFYRILEWV